MAGCFQQEFQHGVPSRKNWESLRDQIGRNWTDWELQGLAKEMELHRKQEGQEKGNGCGACCYFLAKVLFCGCHFATEKEENREYEYDTMTSHNRNPQINPVFEPSQIFICSLQFSLLMPGVEEATLWVCLPHSHRTRRIFHVSSSWQSRPFPARWGPLMPWQWTSTPSAS